MSLDQLFAPSSVAVVGASADPAKAGFAMLAALAGAPRLHPVNPRGGDIDGRAVYTRIGDIPERVDLAVLVVPPAAVPGVLQECVAAGVGAAVVCSGGFAESGEEGAALQEQLQQIVAGSSLRLLGPNTSGFVNPGAGIRANFMPSVVSLQPGPVGVLAQSGGMNLAISFLLDRDGIGISLGVGLGNAVDVGFVDVLDHLRDDVATSVVAMHVEGVADGHRLVEALRRTTAVKPVVALKVGHAGVSAFAQSHTGALAGDWAVTRAALEQAGAVVVDTLSDLVDAVSALAWRRLPPARDPGVAVVTGQAGPGLLIADELARFGLRTPELADTTVKELGNLLPPLTFQRNPVDTGRPESSFPAVLQQVAADNGVDLTVVYALHEFGMQGAVSALVDAGRSADRFRVGAPAGAGPGTPTPPTLFISGGADVDLAPARRDLRAVGIPFFSSPDRGARGAWALVADARLRERAARPVSPGGEVPRLSLSEPLDEDQAKTVLGELGLATPRRLVVRNHAEAAAAMATLGAPVVVKLLDAAVHHKSDIGAVHVGVDSARALETALIRIDAAAGGRAARYLIEAQAPSGVELIVGATRDPAFGPTVLLGIGGVDVEAFGRAALALAPLTPADAQELVRQLPEFYLRGARGRPPIPQAALAAALTSIGDLMVANPEISEIDVNPVRVTAEGLLALDALILSNGGHEAGSPS